MNPFRENDRVRFRQTRPDPEPDEGEHYVIEAPADSDRVRVITLLPNTRLCQREWIPIAMLEKMPPAESAEEDPTVVIVREVPAGQSGRYLAPDKSWTDDKRKAARYFRRADNVDAQLAEVQRRFGFLWKTEDWP